MRRFGYAYLALLALSQLTQLAFRPSDALPSGMQAVEVPVRIAYRETGEGEPVVYLHGSPGSSGDARNLARELPGFRVIAPDLPGFGASSRSIPDYGIEAHARYVLALMDALGIERAHLVGHSMGSGVALHVAHLAPERVASIVSYAGIGVQEGEGSGDYHLEHAKYAAGYVLLVALPEVVPHFGLLGPRAARHAFIRNFWDTDQRPLRGILEHLTTPLLIVHGDQDPLVPVWAAREHHRIVQASELVVLHASHFLVFTQDGAARLAAEIAPFLERHSDPAAKPVRRTVDPGMDVPRASPWTYLALLFWGTFGSEDLTCISAGLLARNGHVDPFVAVLGCFLGIFVSDVGLWLAGRVLGRRALGWRWVRRRIAPERVLRFGAGFDRRLGRAVFASRFLPGTRVPMYVAAGATSKRPVAFTLWLAAAGLVWTPLLVGAALVFGPLAAKPFEAIAGVGWVSWILAALALFVLLRIAVLATSWRGRARLAAQLSRIRHPEFWPVWLFYLPLVPWIAWLALRHGLTTPTAANPAIPHGGVVGESKYRILQALPPERIIPSFLAVQGAHETRVRALAEHMSREGWGLPLVLKPDEGQRGAGLKLARDESVLHDYLKSYEREVLVQPYDPGPYEAGVFYYRIPGEDSGKIFSITDKRFPEVVGDGRSTLEELILRDRRLRVQAGVFTRRLARTLDEVPQAGEPRRLAVAGNHCQGTMFLDGSHHATPALERAIDEVAKRFDGFFFGRFDVRYGDLAAFREGRDFRIVELNGVTSESTNVYDPAYGLLRTYRTLGRQWSLAFRIGAANRRLGHRVSSLAALYRAAREHYRWLPEGVAD